MTINILIFYKPNISRDFHAKSVLVVQPVASLLTLFNLKHTKLHRACPFPASFSSLLLNASQLSWETSQAAVNRVVSCVSRCLQDLSKWH